MRACACGERSIVPCAWRGRLTSSIKRPAPRSSRGSSVRRTGLLEPKSCIEDSLLLLDSSPPFHSSSSVNVPPMTDRKSEHDQPRIVDLADDPEITDPVSPKPGAIPAQGLPEMPRVLAAL